MLWFDYFLILLLFSLFILLRCHFHLICLFFFHLLELLFISLSPLLNTIKNAPDGTFNNFAFGSSQKERIAKQFLILVKLLRLSQKIVLNPCPSLFSIFITKRLYDSPADKYHLICDRTTLRGHKSKE